MNCIFAPPYTVLNCCMFGFYSQSYLDPLFFNVNIPLMFEFFIVNCKIPHFTPPSFACHYVLSPHYHFHIIQNIWCIKCKIKFIRMIDIELNMRWTPKFLVFFVIVVSFLPRIYVKRVYYCNTVLFYYPYCVYLFKQKTYETNWVSVKINLTLAFCFKVLSLLIPPTWVPTSRQGNKKHGE